MKKVLIALVSSLLITSSWAVEVKFKCDVHSEIFGAEYTQKSNKQCFIVQTLNYRGSTQVEQFKLINKRNLSYSMFDGGPSGRKKTANIDIQINCSGDQIQLKHMCSYTKN
ncbi:hypothetical protein CBF23_007415 [Marinomonas agarivorans]|nr:hypothetical protein CBF23_007415 [Marinomonas agarivorans]